MKKLITAIVLFILAGMLSGCGIVVLKDEYSLDKIDGDITCEYRVGKDAMWAKDSVDSDVRFDKEMFLKLFNEYNAYDPRKLRKKPEECDLKIDPNEQPEAFKQINDSEFNVRAVFAGGQRNVSIYRYEDKMYFFVLYLGGQSDPSEEGDYYMELSEEMSTYWKGIIEAVEE